LCHPEYDNLNGETYEQCQDYRIKIKEILEDIMHVEKGYLNTESATNQHKHIPVRSGDNLVNGHKSNGVEIINGNNRNVPHMEMNGKNKMTK
jgi:hypothetical protein